ncbi:helix-turn-helix transcriptional regulator [Micromonospora sp. Llam7]|uniref:helix-turn-helix domain-containing protein n=1 Tax=Micromonospora tarapacensis TaxID=2835305 RepID=UPI001C835715|nr:helix-turn-helix transcriptional regulator [Micromonospora tarapacensis]MBX7264711.1 helix-turn-helix transcriptional regulator [Micromonospora tarapacensis]
MSPSPPDPPMTGPVVARLRRARGWSQSRLAAELCAAAGVSTLSRHEISRWERQVRAPGRFWRGWLTQVLPAPGDPRTHAATGGRDRPAARRTRPGTAAPTARPLSSRTTTRRGPGGSARRGPTH